MESFSRDKLNDSQSLGKFSHTGQVRSIKFKDLRKLNICANSAYTLRPRQTHKQQTTTKLKNTMPTQRLLFQPLYIITTYAR